MRVLGKELIPKLDEISTVLGKHNPTTRQQLLELLCASHAITAECNTKYDAESVARAMQKHIMQIITQWKQEETKQ